jgi:membrane dipeptidase
LHRREFLRAGALAGVSVLAGPFINKGRFHLFADERGERVEHSARAIELVGRSMVIDMLGLLTLDWPKLYAWQRDPLAFGPTDFQKLQSSGIKIFHPAVEPNEPRPYEGTLEWIAGWNRLLESRPDRFLRIGTPSDIAALQAAREPGKIGILIGFQNSDHFRTVDDVRRFHALGQRVSQLTYNARNRIGCGCRESRDKGLSAYGAEIVAAMNRVGMAVDVSHCSERTCLDTFAASKKPVLITHSNCRAIADNPRCKSDAVIRAMAARGGVMGITAIAAFVSPRRPATIDDVLNHFERVIRLAGIEHVGLGSDVDLEALDPRTGRVHARYDVRGLPPARRVFDLTESLIRRGYDDRSIELILGGNFQRALTEIWSPPPAPAGDRYSTMPIVPSGRRSTAGA